MNIARLKAITARWREEAELFDRRGQDGLARQAESYAAELEEEVNAWYLESLTLKEASEESGIPYSTLQQKLSHDELPNSGEKGSPRIQRRYLPSRGGSPHRGGPDIAAEILSVS